MSASAAAVPGDRWALVTGENEFRRRDIAAFVAARCDIVDLYVFWCNHMGFCVKEAAENFNKKLDALYATLMLVPVWTLTREVDGPDGVLRYINKYYWEDEANELNRIHRNRVEANARDVWRDMQGIDKEVARTWKMGARVKTEYETVKQKAFSSVRAWLKIPEFEDLRRREETGRRKYNMRAVKLEELLLELKMLR